MTKARRNTWGIYLLLVLMLIGSAGCSVLTLRSNIGEKPLNSYAFSRQPKTEAEKEADLKTCKEWATKSTNFNPDIARKWSEDAKDFVAEFVGLITVRLEWKQANDGCLEASGYVVK